MIKRGHAVATKRKEGISQVSERRGNAGVRGYKNKAAKPFQTIEEKKENSPF